MYYEVLTTVSLVNIHHQVSIFVLVGATTVKNPPANAGDSRDEVLITGSGRSSGVGNDNPLQYSCLENPMDRGTWWATVYGVTNNQTRLNTQTMKTFKV